MPKLGEDQKKGLRRKLKYFSPKSGKDQKERSSPTFEVFLFLNHFFRGIWCFIRPEFVNLFPLIIQRSNLDGGTRFPYYSSRLLVAGLKASTLTRILTLSQSLKIRSVLKTFADRRTHLQCNVGSLSGRTSSFDLDHHTTAGRLRSTECRRCSVNKSVLKRYKDFEKLEYQILLNTPK